MQHKGFQTGSQLLKEEGLAARRAPQAQDQDDDRMVGGRQGLVRSFGARSVPQEEVEEKFQKLMSNKIFNFRVLHQNLKFCLTSDFEILHRNQWFLSCEFHFHPKSSPFFTQNCFVN